MEVTEQIYSVIRSVAQARLPEEWEDLAHDSALAILEHRGDVRDVRAYARQIVVNLAARAISERIKQRDREMPLHCAPESGVESNPFIELQRRREIDAVRAAIASVRNPIHRDVLLRVVAHEDPQQIAAALCLTSRQYRSRRWRSVHVSLRGQIARAS